jgi:hypothetical protein
MNQWNSINSLLRFNDIFPFNGLGEIFSGGIILTFSVACIIGLVNNFIHSLLIKKQDIIQIILFILGVYLITLLNQYNLRSSFRIIYYIFIIQFFFMLLEILKKKLKKDYKR